MNNLGLNYKFNYYEIASIFRISVVFIALIDFLSLIYDFRLFFSTNAIVPIQLGIINSQYFSILSPLYELIEQNNIQLDLFMYTLCGMYLFVLICCLLGFYTKISFLFAILLQLIIFRSITSYNYGYDYFITMSFYYCLIFPVGKAYSIDYRNKGYTPKVPNFFFSLITFLKIHLCIVYLTSGLAKCSDPNWWNGNAIWRAMVDLNTDFYISPYILMFLSIGTVLLEVFYPIFAFIKFKFLRKILIINVVLMHLGIGVFLELSSFAAVMIIWNITAFYKDFTNE